VLTGTLTLKARAFLPGFAPSGVATATFTIDPAGQSGRPTIAPRGGWFDTKQIATFGAAAGATVRYTLNGADPTTSDSQVPVEGLTIDRSRLVKVRAWDGALTPSSVARADFAITGAVAAGQYHSLVVTSAGVLWAWGNNGDGTGIDRSTPVQIMTDVASIAGNRLWSMALKRDGTVWRWGYGIGASPTQVPGLANITAIAAGEDHGLALHADGTVWAWGGNSAGQLGDDTTTNRATPVQVIGLRGVRSIAAGEDFSLAVEGDGATGGWVWAWGLNAIGQLGDGTTLSRKIPVRVPGLSNVAQVAAGNVFGLARLTDGTVRSWGGNDLGQLGVGSTAITAGVQAVALLTGIRIVSASGWHGMATDVDGRLWAWGNNSSSQLGLTNQALFPSPQLVAHIPSSVMAAGGFMHTIALRADGTVWAMGGGAGSLPGGSTTGAQVPDLITGDQSALTADQDSDGLPTWRELMRGTDPLDADSNDNGLTDGIEVGLPEAGANADEDGDGLSSAAEIAKGTDPFLADTDGDGFNDGVDAFPLDPTRHDPLTPTSGDTTPPVITLTEPTNAVPLP